jgi:hypothetical protein
MALAQLLYQTDYITYFKQIRRGDHGSVVIMDNGAAEGGAMSPEELIGQADQLRPDVLVVPDVIQDPDASYGAACSFLEHKDWLAYKEMMPLTQLMMVPHGATYSEWLRDLDRLLSLDPQIIGVARAHTRLAPDAPIHGRASLVREVFRHSKRVRVHLLGLTENPVELFPIAREFGARVMGVDTALPWVLAAEELRLETYGLLYREKFWHSNEVSSAFTPEQILIAQHNFRFIRDWAQGIGSVLGGGGGGI